ncbi:hypothetical protein TSUD_352050 [Trifolium subterraneum]|nr:hypothetical protein TSUD_352050 [Trifolium subterraneum]
MGCICSKGSSKSTNEYVAQNHTIQFIPNKSSKHLVLNNHDSTARLISNTYRNSSDEGHKQNVFGIIGEGGSQVEKDDDEEEGRKRISRCLSYGERGSLIVVGWPSWLTSVAPEAIAGWVPRRPDSFHKLDKIGQGTYSSVYRARDLETNKIVALKKVKFANMDPESVRFMAREIVLLRRLDHPNVMKLEGMITSKLSGSFLLEVLLAIEPSDRGTASSALQNEFFTSMPLPCDPSTLPKYPPSKEFDARLREEEARRRRTANKGQGRQESVGRNFKESKVVPAPDANVKLQASIEQKRRVMCNSKYISEKYNPEKEGGCLPLEPAKSRAHNIFSHSGQSMHPSAYGSSRNMNLKEEVVITGPDRVFTSRNSEMRKQNSYWHGRAAQLSRFSNSLAVRGDSRLDMGGDRNLNSQWLEDHFDTRSNHLPDGESNQLLDGTKHSHKKDFHLFGKDRAMDHAPKNCHINYSGPLFPPEDNLEEILKEHERQIQQAVRKARLAKENKKG